VTTRRKVYWLVTGTFLAFLAFLGLLLWLTPGS
jgi:hypothetical protein